MSDTNTASPVPVDVAEDGVQRTPKVSVYAEAADPAKYRVKDAALFTCAAHMDATVLCTTAGKTGRNGRSAAVGATILWLTCPYINNMVARMERHGGVQTAARCFDEHAALRERHVASHTVYEALAQRLLEADQWRFFCDHFVRPTNGAADKKYGNAAVCHAEDLKCLHALVAQTLGGAPNPLGDAVVNYILLCYQIMAMNPENETGRAVLSRLVNSDILFTQFLAQTIAVKDQQDGDVSELRVAGSAPDSNENAMNVDSASALCVRYEWIHSAEQLAALKPDLCQRCLELTVFLDGKPPSLRRKHRLN